MGLCLYIKQPRLKWPFWIADHSNLNTIKNLNTINHSKSECVRYSSPHCYYLKFIAYSIFEIRIIKVCVFRNQICACLIVAHLERCSVFQSRNAAVVMATTQLFHHCAPRAEIQVVAKAMIRLLRSHPEVQVTVIKIQIKKLKSFILYHFSK